jgi:hypothetical protein
MLFDVVGRSPELAARHGLSAFVADELARESVAVPPELAREAHAQLSRGLKTKSLTLAVVDALKTVQVTPVLLKGYALALRLYPEQPLGRPSTDVDVLVEPHELARCAEALATLGLHRHDDAALHDPMEEHHHLAFSGPRGLVEVHFRLFMGFGGGVFDDAGLFSRARTWTLHGRAVRLLGEEDEFLYLATHAANHAFMRLSWLLDLQRYLAVKRDLDFALMATRAHRAGFHTAVTTSLVLLQRVLGASLPPGALRHFPVHALREPADAWLFSRERLASAALSDHWLAAFLLRLWLVDTPAHGLRHLVEGARRSLRRARLG